MSVGLPDKRVTVTQEFIDRSMHLITMQGCSRDDSFNNPVALAFSYEFDRQICVSRGPSTAPLDKRSAHRLWTAYLLDDYILPEEFQKFLNWWTYGRASNPEKFDTYVKPIVCRISR